jgi:membrane-associated protein
LRLSSGYGQLFDRSYLGSAPITSDGSRKYLKRRAFFEKHGVTIFCRFVPIVHVCAVVAGIGKMSYGYFISYNFFGGIVWVALFTFAGYFFGNIPFVKKNFEFVIVAIILISVLPMLYEWLRARREGRQVKAEA